MSKKRTRKPWTNSELRRLREQLTKNPWRKLTVTQQLHFPDRALSSLWYAARFLGFERCVAYKFGGIRRGYD